MAMPHRAKEALATLDCSEFHRCGAHGLALNFQFARENVAARVGDGVQISNKKALR
jgi:hypothetical protein